MNEATPYFVDSSSRGLGTEKIPDGVLRLLDLLARGQAGRSPAMPPSSVTQADARRVSFRPLKNPQSKGTAEGTIDMKSETGP